MPQIDNLGLAQDCTNSTANALELLQSCTKPSKWSTHGASIDFIVTKLMTIQGPFQVQIPYYKDFNVKFHNEYMGQVTKVGVSSYLVLLSFDSKTR